MGASPALRLEQLLRWKRATDARGFATPSASTLQEIASLNTVHGNYEAAVGEWRETLGWILHQLKMGVVDPVAQLPNELLAPVAGSGSNGSTAVSSWTEGRSVVGGRFEASSSSGDPRQEAVLEWRRAAIAAGREDVAALKEGKLRLIARMPRSTPADIAKSLSASMPLATEIAEVLTRASTPTPVTRPESVPQPEPPAHPYVPQPESPQFTVPPAQPVSPGQSTSDEARGQSADGRRAPTASRRERRGATAMGTYLDLAPEDFEEFDYFDAPETVHQIRATGSVAAGMTYSWPPLPADPGDVVVYRLVSNDEHRPWGPDKGDFVGATCDTKVADSRPHGSAVRHIQVWAYVGADIEDATGQQPVLYAHTSVVSPVADLEIREDQGRVIGQWSVFEGVEAVQIYRIPVDRAAFGGDDPQFRIFADMPNLGGFVDRNAERGKRYIYRVRAEAEVDGTTRLSTHAQAEVFVSALLEAVTDMAVVWNDANGEPQFDLTWTTPAAGRVIVYRTDSGPTPGADAAPLAEGALAQAGLPIEARLAHPISSASPTMSTMIDVPWPREWTRAYFTPVTVLDDRYQVGRTTSATRTDRIAHVEIVERVDKQILTFTWPAGAASVLVYKGVLGQPAGQGLSGQPTEISAGMYERFGGLHLPERLPSRGCSLHLVPVAFAAGERIQGQAVSKDYPGMLRVFYDLNVARGATGEPVLATIELAAESDVAGSPPFALIHNPDRLPLSVRDGEPLDVLQAGDASARPAKMFSLPGGLTAKPSGVKFQADLRGRGGFVRLFAQLPPARLRVFALLDPPVAKLTLSAGRRR